MNLSLPRLPYPSDALEPYISRDAVETHHGTHHRAYIEKSRDLAKQVRLADLPLEKIILKTTAEPSHRALFNNAAQAWNHACFWRSLRPQGGGLPHGEIAAQIAASFGSHETFADVLYSAVNGIFGSGWAWLVLADDKLSITQTSNADTPLAHGQVPLLAIDAWEHAYYLDYQSRRADYASAVIEHLLNWDYANQNLRRARAATHSHATPSMPAEQAF